MIRLKKDASLAAGTGFQPVDLVSRTSGRRLPLSSDEAAVAMLLADGAEPGEGLVHLAWQHGVMWDLTAMQSLLDRLGQADFLEQVQEGSGLDEAVEDEEQTVIDAQWGGEFEEDTDPQYALVENLEVHALADGNLEVLDPETQRRTRLHPNALQIARLFDGTRTVADVMEAMRSAGANVELDQLSTLTKTLLDRGVLLHKALPAGWQAAPPPPAPQAIQADPVRPLAAATLLVRDHRLPEARAMLETLIKQDPDNVQALAMLELINGIQETSTKAHRRWLLITPISLAVVVLGLILAGLLIQVPDRVVVPCKATTLTLARVDSPLTGKVLDTDAVAGQVVAKGQTLAVVADPSAERRLAELREQLESDQELLHVMRIGGSDQIERKQKRLLGRLNEELARLQQTCRSKCADRIQRVNRRIENTRTKLKFCEWQALPAEVTAKQEEMERATQKLKALESRPLRATVASPASGLVQELVASGAQVSVGGVLTVLVDPDNFLVEARYADPGRVAGRPVIVELTWKNATEAYRGTMATAQNKIRVQVRAEVRQVRLSGKCSLKFERGKVSAIRSLLRR